MIRITNAQKVAPKQPTTHTQHNSLAEAFNTRILSGLGDCAWRIFYYAYSTFRGLRNPDGDAYPAQDEWFKFYAHIEPKIMWGKFGWPEAPAGEAQGSNVANPFMAWIFGNNSKTKKANGESDDTKDRVHGFWSEPIRLSGLEAQLPMQMPVKTSGDPNLNRVWSDSEIQRGCCAFYPNYLYLPRNALQPSVKELQLVSLGICAAARRHLRYVMETVSMGRYASSYVPDIDGKGGIFRKKNAVKDQIEQAMFYYLSFFRGVEDQRAKHDKVKKNVRTEGFNFESFFARQFLLAPNYSRPKYELDQSGQVKKDTLGNNLIKYDSIGYPELFPENKSFIWRKDLDNSESPNIITIPSNYLNTPIGIASTSDGYFFKDINESISFDTDPEDPGFKNIRTGRNRFCLSAIFIQTSDIASRTVNDANSLLNDLFIDVYLYGKLYDTIPINNNDDKYIVTRRTAAVNNGITGQPNQYQIYQFNRIHYFQYPVKGLVSFRVRSSSGAVNFGKKITDGDYSLSNFSIFIKTAHVFDMKPTVADAYVMMRVATTEGAGSDAGQMDPVGHFNGETCKRVFQNYIKYGVAYTLNKGKTLYQNDSYVSANPIYESARKFITSNIRMADRISLIDYEVDVQGRSVLYFSRYAYGMKNSGIDIFRGIAPSITPVGNRTILGSKTEIFIPIVKGKEYIVLDLSKNKDGYIYYRNSNSSVSKLTHGKKFKGGDYYFASGFSNDTVGIYELDGIIASTLINESPKASVKIKVGPEELNQISNGNISNEWCMFMSYNLYHWSNSSAWKPEMYGDIMGAFNGRCLTSSISLEYYRSTSKNVKKHLANVTWRPYDIPLVVESPSGYNYIESANTDLSKAGGADYFYAQKFAKSCQIYVPPYQIQSTSRINPYDPKCDVIKVVLNTRLSASSINGSTAVIKGKVSENLDYFTYKANAFEFRSDESAAIDYVLHYLTGRSCPRAVIGDVSLDNNFFWSKQRPFGCCYPRFYFVKLIPKVSAGTVMYSDHYTQMEYYLRAMCNGFINTDTEMAPNEIQQIISERNTGIDLIGGYDSAIGDYLFEDLMRKSYDISTNDYAPMPTNMTSTA